jgi:hypothetical protein
VLSVSLVGRNIEENNPEPSNQEINNLRSWRMVMQVLTKNFSIFI